MKPRIDYLLLGTALLGTFFSGTATRIVAISMPTVADSLGTDLLGISWALLAYQLSNIGLSIVFGRLADLWSREKIYSLGFLVFALSSLGCGFAQTIVHLIVARFVQGVGGAMLQSSSRALAAESVPENLAGRAQGYMTTAHHVGFILGPSIGGLMIDYLSWRWSFFLLAPIGFGGALLAFASAQAARVRRLRGSIDYAGAALLIATTTSLVLLFDRRTHELITGKLEAALALFFLLSLGALLWHERRTESPFIDVSLFRIRRFSLSVLSLLIMASCYALTTFLLPFYLQGVLGFSPTSVGLFFMLPSFLTIGLAFVSGWLSDRLGPRVPASLGALIMVGSLALGAWLEAESHWLLPALLIVLGAATNGIFNPANSTAMIAMMPKEHRGFASAMNHVTFGLGNVLGVASSGFLMAVAFEQYGGAGAGGPSTAHPEAFVAALNVTFAAAAGLCLIAVISSGAKTERTAR